MITAKRETTAVDVGGHYDELDEFYRRAWGEHLHHGYWAEGNESTEDATLRLIEYVADRLQTEPGQAVCDVGCGYGGSSRYLASKYGLWMTGLTVSQAQFDYAKSQPGGGENAEGNPTYFLRRWEENRFDDESFDGVISLECIGHVPDKWEYFRQAYRVLRPGGRLAITAWLSGDEPSDWEEKHLLEPICREGRLPSMGTSEEYTAALQDSGLQLVDYEDISDKVARTWKIVSGRVATRLLPRWETWRYLLGGQHRHAIFLLTTARIYWAYRRGAMRYGVFVAQK